MSGPLDPPQLRRIHEELEESALPLRVDAVDLIVADERLRAHALDGAVALSDAVAGLSGEWDISCQDNDHATQSSV